MIDNFKRHFDALGERFSTHYSDGSMSIEVIEFKPEPTIESVKDYLRREGYAEKELLEVECEIISELSLLRDFELFFITPNLGYTKGEIRGVLDAFLLLVDGDVIVAEATGEPFDSLSLIAKVDSIQYTFRFWWQYD